MSVAGCEFGDVVSIALGVELRHRAFGEVAAVAGLPFVVDVGEHGADEADHGGFVGEDAHDAGAALDFLVEPLERVRRPDLASSALGGRRRRRGRRLWRRPSARRSWGTGRRAGRGPGPRSRRRSSGSGWAKIGAERGGDHVLVAFGDPGEHVLR